MALSVTAYEVSWLSRFFHSFPHVDLTFQHVNSTFDPPEARYREALVFWAAIPVIWLLLTLVVFLMYFCYRCCQRDVEKKQRVPCLRWSMAILALLTCAAVGVGIYGNVETKKGIDQFQNSLTDADMTIRNVQKEIDDMDTDLKDSVGGGLKTLVQLFKRPPFNITVRNKLDDLMSKALTEVDHVIDDISSISLKSDVGSMDSVVDQSGTVGFYSWLSTLIFLCWMILLCLLLLLGIGISSKCTLLIFCAFGIFTMVLCWMSAGIHTGVSVGAGDFCIDPDTYVESLYKEGNKRDIVQYYVKCNTVMSKSPYGNALKDASGDLRAINKTFTEARQLIKSVRKPEIPKYVRQVLYGLNSASESLLHLTALVECTNLHKDYRDAIIGLCSVVFPGLVFLLLSFILCGLLFTVLVILASRAWRHFSRSVYTERQDTAPKGYLEVDEDDPFLPRGDNATSYYRYGDSLQSRPNSVHEDGGASFTRQGRPPGSATAGAGIGGGAGNGPNQRDHQMSIQRRPTPPPAVEPLNEGKEISQPSAPPQYNSYDYRSPTEVHHHMGDSPSAPLAHHDDYPTFNRESHA